MAEDKARRSLKTLGDLRNAVDWLFHEQESGRIDAKTSDALNTTLKTAVDLNVKLPLAAAKIWYQAQVKKLEIPAGMLPPMA